MIDHLRRVGVLARLTFLESLRNRILLTTLFFGIVLVMLSVGAASVVMGDQVRLILDVGLAAASALGAVIAIAVAISSFGAELSNRTAYVILARPVPRWNFVAGKFLGLWATMTLVTTTMLVTTALVAYFYGGSPNIAFWLSMPLVSLEMGVVISFTLLFSALSSPVLAASYSVGAWFAGNLADDMRSFAQKYADRGADQLAALMGLVYRVLPDLSTFSLRTEAANHLDIPPGLLSAAFGYGLLYSAGVLMLAMIVFERRSTL